MLLTNHAFGLFCRLGRRMPAQIPRINRLVTRLAGASRRVDRSDRIFASPRLVRFTEMEYALPRERTVEAVRRVLELVEGGRRRAGRVAAGRATAGHGRPAGLAGAAGLPSPCPSRSRCAPSPPTTRCSRPPPGATAGIVAVHMFEGMAWEPYFRAVEAIMDELGGRPHWGKRHFQTAATLRERYPEWERFQAVRRRLDPEGRFANDYTDRVLGADRSPPSGAGGLGRADRSGCSTAGMRWQQPTPARMRPT